MGLFGPSTAERHAAAAQAIRPYGFVLDPSAAVGLGRYLPFELLATPQTFATCALGEIEDAPVEAYEYGYSSRDSDGNTTYRTELVIAVHHASIRGRASIRPEWREWSVFAAALDIILWVPPFTLVKAIQLLAESRHPDRSVGDSDFDRLYVVRAASDAAAREAIPQPLRDALMRIGFKGTLEIRPGVLLYSPHRLGLDGEGAVPALGIATVLLAALRRPEGYRGA